jgi:hypothetical protein
VSVGITAMLFWAAFGSMLSRYEQESRDRAIVSEATEIVRLPVPPEKRPVVPPAVVVRPPTKTVPTPKRAVDDRIPAPTTPPNAVPPAAASQAVALPTPVAASRDSGGSPASAPTPISTAVRGGAPIAPAGITLHGAPSGAGIVRESIVRDSILRTSMRAVPGIARNKAPSAAEREELAESQRQAEMVQRRTTSVGNSRDLKILHGNTMGGAGASTGGGSVGLSLFSSGPSAAQRKKNAAIDSEYRMRLGRLQERVRVKRDSIRADSLRQDSLARKGRVPE